MTNIYIWNLYEYAHTHTYMLIPILKKTCSTCNTTHIKENKSKTITTGLTGDQIINS